MPWASDEKGAVTAELMMLFPVLILGAGLLGMIFSVSLERITLERDTAAALREIAIGRDLEVPEGINARTWTEGRLVCLEFKKSEVIQISAAHCALPLA
jgi:hypothetical protein